MKKCALVIPALNPGHMLIDYVSELFDDPFDSIIVVDDGSSLSHADVFTELKRRNCVVLRHKRNRGKGQALKTAFRYLIYHTNSTVIGAVTADADGQHTVEDVKNIAEMLKRHPEHIVLGSRYFDHASVPTRSKLGNKLTSFIFHCLFGRYLVDTQTGLRGISKENMAWILQIKGDRYEFEMNMLIHAIKRNIAIQEHKIETVYYDRNMHSYFKTVIDSLKIGRRILSEFMNRPKRVNTEQGVASQNER